MCKEVKKPTLLFELAFQTDFLKFYPYALCCICRLVTNNLCVSTWTGTEEYCRAEALGVILGVVDSTIVETKQKNY